jgi:hypothetical protein
MSLAVAAKFTRIAVLAGLSAAAASAAVADSTTPVVNLNNSSVAVSGTRDATPTEGLLTDRFVATLGTFIVNTNLSAELNGQSVKNPEVNFNDSLGVGGDFNRARLDFMWRINPNHHIRFLVFTNNNTYNRVVDRNIEWGDYTFQTNTNIQTNFKFNVYELGYEYAFLHGPTYEVGATAGVHYLDMSLKISGTATVTDANGNVGTASYSSKTSSLPAPLPVIGLRGGWAIAPNWYLDAQAQVFKFKLEGYDGNWSDLRAGVTWMFSRHFGVGAGYNRFHANVDITKAAFNGNVSLGYSGAQVFVTGTY